MNYLKRFFSCAGVVPWCSIVSIIVASIIYALIWYGVI